MAEYSRKHLIYALISMSCPIVAVVIVTIVQMFAYADYWHPLEKGLIFVELSLGAIIGSVVGMLFGILSINYQPKLVSPGTAAILLNAIPLLYLFFVIAIAIFDICRQF